MPVEGNDAVQKNGKGNEDEIFIPSDPVVVLLSVLVILSILFTAYFAAEIVLPIVLAFVLKLLFQPGMRFLERFKIPKSVSALILILLVFGAIIGIGAAVSGPAAEWASRLPSGVQKLQERLKFLNEPINALRTFFHQLDGYVGAGSEASGGSSGMITGIATGILSSGTHFASSFFETILILFFYSSLEARSLRGW